MEDFKAQVFEATRLIPSGSVVTYYDIAQAIGSPKAVRAVGNALNKSPGMPSVPCHRVIRSDGTIGGFALGSEKKMQAA